MKNLDKWLPLVLRIVAASLMFFVLSLLITGCGTMHKVVNKSSSDSTVTTNTSKQAEIITTEKVDTNVSIKGDTAKASKPLESVLKGDTVESSTNGTRVRMWYDPTNRTLHGEAITDDRNVPVQIDRTTTTKANEQTETQADVRRSETHVDKTVEPTPWYFSPWPWLVLFLLVVFGYLLYRYTP